MDKIKVLYIIDTLEGYGAERSLVHIAENLKYVSPVFLQVYEGDTLKKRLEKSGVKVYSLNIRAKYGFRTALNGLKEVYDKERPNIIHATLFRSEIIARKFKKRNPETLLVGSFVSNSYSSHRFKQMRPLSKLKLHLTQIKDRATSRYVDFFICNSKTIKETNSKALNIPKDKIKVIYRGRENNFGDNKKLKKNLSNLKKTLGISDSEIVFLNVSRLQRGKGQLDLLEAFKIVNRNISNVKLLIAGEGPLRYELEKEIANLNLGNKVSLLGYREDVSNLLELSDYFIFPSYYEGLPGALIEAILAKKPVIASGIDENVECFPHRTPYFFQIGNSIEMAHKMAEAIEEDHWDSITDNAYNHAVNNFGIKEISIRYEEFYSNLLKNKI